MLQENIYFLYMINFSKLSFLIIYFIFAAQVNSYAYLDPGSTSIILQFLSIVLAFVLICYNYIKTKIILFFQKLKKIFEKKKEN
jgi:cell shape-determining protein MreC